MRCPPIEWSDMIALGMPPEASVTVSGEEVKVSPEPSPLLSSVMRSPAISLVPHIEEDRIGYVSSLKGILLSETNWTQASDAPLSQVEREAWASWRESVREVSDSGSGPVQWPAPPIVSDTAVPKSATVWQVLTWLRAVKGKSLSDVEDAIAAIQDQDVRNQATIDLRHASEFFRDDPLLASIAQAWEIDLDQAFREAALIQRVR
jgi:hypothetical protein